MPLTCVHHAAAGFAGTRLCVVLGRSEEAGLNINVFCVAICSLLNDVYIYICIYINMCIP